MTFSQVENTLAFNAGSRVDFLASLLGVQPKRLAPLLGRMRKDGLVLTKNGYWWTCQYDAFEPTVTGGERDATV